MRILLVEDNQRLSRSLGACLKNAGYSVDAVFEGPEGEAFAELTPYDAIILDIMLPGRDGFAICRGLRRRQVGTPIIMLTARDAVEDRVRGLDGGADDYLVKPFAVNELLARLRALMRREPAQLGNLLEVGDLSIDPVRREVHRAGQLITLTAREFALLELFMRHPGQVITRDVAEAHIWNDDFAGGSNVVDVYVRRLRRKLDEPFPTKLIHTVRGAGYQLRLPVPSNGDS